MHQYIYNKNMTVHQYTNKQYDSAPMHKKDIKVHQYTNTKYDSVPIY